MSITSDPKDPYDEGIIVNTKNGYVWEWIAGPCGTLKLLYQGQVIPGKDSRQDATAAVRKPVRELRNPTRELRKRKTGFRSGAQRRFSASVRRRWMCSSTVRGAHPGSPSFLPRPFAINFASFIGAMSFARWSYCKSRSPSRFGAELGPRPHQRRALQK
jgi:hypothetical protein